MTMHTKKKCLIKFPSRYVHFSKNICDANGEDRKLPQHVCLRYRKEKLTKTNFEPPYVNLCRRKKRVLFFFFSIFNSTR